MSVQYKILDGNMIKSERNAPFFQEKVLQEANCEDVSTIDYLWEPDDKIVIVLKDNMGKVIFDIDRDALYPPSRKNPKMCRFHRDFWDRFIAPVATDKVFSTVDLEQFAPKA